MPEMIQSLLLRTEGGEITRPADLVEALGPGPWLCVSPHDDDMVIGMGLTVAAACEAGIEVHLGVVSDGAMGYPRPEDIETIVETRRGEVLESSRRLGLPAERVHMLDLPDGELMSMRGAQRRSDGCHTGVGRRITALMRQVRPRIVFGPNPADVHPDHQAVAGDLDVACFWAGSAIWLELGEPIAIPVRWDYAIYAPFVTDPHLRVEATEVCRRAKSESFAAFASQQYVTANAEMAHPSEFLRRADWSMYRPSQYDALFRKG